MSWPIQGGSTVVENYLLKAAQISQFKKTQSTEKVISFDNDLLIRMIPLTWTPRRIILGTLVVLLVIAGFLLLYRFRQVAVIVFSGIVISIAIAPSVDWLQKRGLPRSLSVILIYL